MYIIDCFRFLLVCVLYYGLCLIFFSLTEVTVRYAQETALCHPSFYQVIFTLLFPSAVFCCPLCSEYSSLCKLLDKKEDSDPNPHTDPLV
jgi:hypothetical protein